MDALLSDALDARRVCVCGPMVRASTLPLRLLVREYGGTLVWTEELVALKLRTCVATRTPDGLTAFVDAKGSTVLLVDEAREAGRLVCQLGVADEASALAAAAVVAPVAAAIEINMGCPKRFSLQAGMGAALLKDAPRAVKIVKALASCTSPVLPPVFVKMRLLESAAATIDFITALLDAGARLITLHARRVTDAPTDTARWCTACEVAAGVAAYVAPRRAPLLLNGDGFTVADVAHMAALPHFRGVMLARGALANASIFGAVAAGDGGGALPPPREVRELGEVVAAYVRIAARVHNHVSNTKYVACAMLKEAGYALPEPLQRARTQEDIERAVEAWRVSDARAPPKPRITSALTRAALAAGAAAGAVDAAAGVRSAACGGSAREAVGGRQGSGADSARARASTCGATPHAATATASSPGADADACVERGGAGADGVCARADAPQVAGVKRRRDDASDARAHTDATPPRNGAAHAAEQAVCGGCVRAACECAREAARIEDGGGGEEAAHS